MAAVAAFIPAILGIAGAAQSAKGARDEAKARRDAANFEADQLDMQAGQQQAASQRVAADQTRMAKFAESRAQALAAASGADASGRTVTDVIGRIAQEGAYRSALATYEGDAEARQMRLRAAANRFSGNMIYKAGETMASAHLLSGASSLYAKYGRNLPSRPADSSPSGSGLNSDGNTNTDAGIGDSMDVA